MHASAYCTANRPFASSVPAIRGIGISQLDKLEDNLRDALKELSVYSTDESPSKLGVPATEVGLAPIIGHATGNKQKATLKRAF